PIEYNSYDHKLFLEFIYNNNLIIGKHILIYECIDIDYYKNDFKNLEYFQLILNEYQNNMSKKCELYNFEKFKLISLTEDFVVLDNNENLISNKDIVKKVQFQGYYNGITELYFINKQLGNFISNHNFTGFKLKPVYKINTNEILFYQLKVINIVEAPNISTEISS
ncbi:hypothetical protein, partial [Clostridium tarantellae]|uniref:hypothetical protein n=1 Tax=Clostridium tarantellae TaxID=39493 RepID=UPI001A9B1687